MVVVDTSVAVKWFFDEEGASRAKALLKGESVGAPDLLYYEFGNYLAMKDFVTSEEASRSVELAKRFRLTVYDASFVALAEALGTELVTADAKLAQKTKSLSFVKLLPLF